MLPNRYKKASAWLIGLYLTSFSAVAQSDLKIENSILNDKNSFYYIDFKNYAKELKNLPIGVFDSGTGGLTVLDALVNFDQNNNKTQKAGADGKLDFAKENFIYLADQANMPYGNYNATGKDDLLKEHIIKDFQFLLSNKYYESASDKTPKTNKSRVKAIVIACNTATAYGYAEAEAFMKKTGLQIPIIGVINAAARGTLAHFENNVNGSIGVFATVGTIASNGYERTLREMITSKQLKGNIQIFNQGGFGLAEAVDEEPDFINMVAQNPQENYRGPSLSNSNYGIDKTLLDVYNFNFDKNKMLCDSKDVEDCSVMQLNDSENYVRYHMVSLLEKMRKAEKVEPLKALILGCTHYPYLVKEIDQVLDELRNYKGNNGQYIYKNLIAEKVHLIDPSVFVAQELYEALEAQNLLSTKGNMFQKSEFYISVPNKLNPDVLVDNQGRFTYDYKYGRNEGEIQEYIKVVPFDKENISEETYKRFEKLIPNTYNIIQVSAKRN